MSNNKNLPQKQENQGIIWETNSWKRRTSIMYAGKEIGFLKLSAWRMNRGIAMLLDREFEIKPTNFWANKIAIIDKIDERIIARLTVNPWNQKTELYVEKDKETFIFHHNMWSTGKWWWERKTDQTESKTQKPNEKLVQNSVLDFFGAKGEFNFGNTGESNLNALILGGLFTMTIRKQQAGAG